MVRQIKKGRFKEMRKFLTILLVLLISVGLYACSGQSDEKEESKEEDGELVLGLTTWTSTIPPTEIVQEILEEMGYTVEIKEADIGIIYSGLANGEIDIYLDSWYPQQIQYLEEYSDTIKQLDPIYEDADAGMVVPNYMEDINDVGDLVGKEDLVNNEIIAIEDGDPAMDELQELIDAYDLDLELISSSEGAMIAAAQTSIEEEEPILYYGWRPHSMFIDLDSKILTNEEHPEFFDGSSVHPIINHDVEQEYPEVYDMLNEIEISIDDMEEMITKLDHDEDPKEIAKEWIEANEEDVSSMINQ